MTSKVTDEIVYLTADEEDKYIVAQANEPFDLKTRKFVHNRVSIRHREDIREVPTDQVQLMDVSPKQIRQYCYGPDSIPGE